MVLLIVAVSEYGFAMTRFTGAMIGEVVVRAVGRKEGWEEIARKGRKFSSSGRRNRWWYVDNRVL
jgi:hypothetical protein